MEAVAIHHVSLPLPASPCREPLVLFGSGDHLPDLPPEAPDGGPPVPDRLLHAGRHLAGAAAALGVLAGLGAVLCLVLAFAAAVTSTGTELATRLGGGFCALALLGAAALSLAEHLAGRWQLVLDPETGVVAYHRRLGPWEISRPLLGPGEVEAVSVVTEHYRRSRGVDVGDPGLALPPRLEILDLHVPVLLLANGRRLRTTLATPYPLLARRCALELCRQLAVELS